MKKFKVIIETKGQMDSRVVETTSADEATRIARKWGRVVSVKRDRGFSFEPPLEIHHRQVILHRMAAMQASKVGTGTALTLMEEHFDAPIGTVCGRLRKQVDNGAMLDKAMENMGPKFFPANVVALIQAGFRGGDSAGALKNAAEFEQEMESIKRGNMGEIYGGLFGFLAAAAMTFGTTRYMAPMMGESAMMQMAGDDAVNPVFTVLASIAEVSMGILTLIFLSLLLLGTLGRLINPSGADKIIVKIPFYKDLVLARNNYTTLYSLSLLVNSGVPMEQALELSADGAPKGSMKDDLEAAVNNVKKGRPWAAAMTSLHPTDRAALGQAMDRKGVMTTLESLSSQYRQLYASRIATLAPMIKGIAALFLMISGAVLFGLTIMPILKMAANGF